MAAVTARFVVTVSAPGRLAGDEPIEIDLAEAGGDADAATRATANVAVSGRLVDRLPSGAALVEAVVDGWRFELEVEDARRVELRRRATRPRDVEASSGPTEIRAIIPGRVAAVRVSAGDAVEAGQALLVVEAMKMQNELPAPRPGIVERLAVGEGETIEPGDVLVVLR